MRERQRWQSEEDSLLRAYVKQYGPREWNLVSQRMNKVLDRDAKSCLERWKNYLKPGIKKGSLSEEEQRLVVSLQAKYGNKWKKIAAEVPGRTAKRLGKWWEVFKEKQHKKHAQDTRLADSSTSSHEVGKYDHILETFAEKYVQKNFTPTTLPSLIMPSSLPSPPPPTLSLPTTTQTPNFFHLINPVEPPSFAIPPWMSTVPSTGASGAGCEFSRASVSSNMPLNSSPSVTLSLSSSSTNPNATNISESPASEDLAAARSWLQEAVRNSPTVNMENLQVALPSSDSRVGFNRLQASDTQIMQQFCTLFHYCKELEEGRQSLFMYKKEASWRLKRIEQQLEAEKARKRREKIEETERKIRELREEEKSYLDKVETDYREQMSSLRRDEEMKEAKMMEMWKTKHLQLTGFFEHMFHACKHC